MGFVELMFLAVGLSMDAFAVSLTNAFTMKKVTINDALKFGIFFGLFQAGMPFIGWVIGRFFSTYFLKFGYIIAFLLLCYIGTKMIYETFNGKNSGTCCALSFRMLFVLSVATSIDALAAGIGFAFIEIDIFLSIFVIGITTFFFSTAAALIGKKVGESLGDKAQVFGGVILILIAIKILIENLI